MALNRYVLTSNVTVAADVAATVVAGEPGHRRSLGIRERGIGLTPDRSQVRAQPGRDVPEGHADCAGSGWLAVGGHRVRKPAGLRPGAG